MSGSLVRTSAIHFPGRVALACLAAVCLAGQAVAAEPTRDEVLAAMRAYEGPSTTGVDRATLTGKLMAGYQGWFTTAGDGAGLGWRHYSWRGEFRPGRCSIDLWPDMTELDPSERYATPFRHADGRVAPVFSSHNRATVLRHFRWMQEYGIDGAFVQRFAVSTARPADLRHCNAVLTHCREGANVHGRAYAVMYDLSGLRAGGVQQVIDDWKLLVDRLRLGRDARDRAYLRHAGKPVVAVWGVGFNDGRAYTLAECDRLVAFLKDDPSYGGNTVMLGVPTGWRTLNRDAHPDPALHATLLRADIISPWTVGRYHSPETAQRHAARDWQPDLAWCREHGKEYLPVVFPGFSWHNMKPESPSNHIPRLKGEFLWRQFVAAKSSGATMVYQAMFDEMDEATAIFKCTNDPPVGESTFITHEGLPTDHYLWLAGMGGRLVRGELEATPQVPARQAVRREPPSPEGFVRHVVRSAYQAGETELRVLLPDGYDASRPHRVLFVLPVEPGTERRFGDGLAEIQRLGLHNKYHLVCVQPTFSHLPWYGDHPTNPLVRQETYFLDVVLPLVRQEYRLAEGVENCLLLGFSKSGWGAWSLLVRHPEIFGRAAAWDAPLAMSEPNKYRMQTVYPTAESFEPYNVLLAIERRADVLAGPARLGLFGYENFQQQNATTHQRLDELKVAHEYRDGPRREHVWESGWLPEAVEFLARPN